MEDRLLRPFISATLNAFETMVGVKVKEGEHIREIPDNADDIAGIVDLNLAPGERMERADITGVIGFASEKMLGSVALSFRKHVALWIYNSMMGEEATQLNADVGDAIGELTNIVCGGAKTEFSLMRLTYDISIPSIVQGESHRVFFKKGITTVVIPFTLETGDMFYLEIGLKVF